MINDIKLLELMVGQQARAMEKFGKQLPQLLSDHVAHLAYSTDVYSSSLQCSSDGACTARAVFQDLAVD